MVNPNKYIDVSYNNPHLDNVAYEIRFPSKNRIIKEYFNFQEAINDIYINFGEDVTFLGLSDRLQPPEAFRRIVFSDENDRNMVKISVNSVSFITKDYKSFNDFKERVFFAMDEFIKSFEIRKLTRCGLRYTNIYKLYEDKEKSISEVMELFEPMFNNKLIPYERIFSQNIELKMDITDLIRITLKSNLNFNKNENRFIHVLDFDTFKLEKISSNSYKNILLDLRSAEKTEFLRFIKQKFIDEEMKITDLEVR